MDINVRVITNGTGNDIISQYVRFTKVANEQIRKYGRTEEAIREILRICMNENILKEYMELCKEEVTDMMNTLFNEEQIWDAYGEERYNDGIKYGRAEGEASGIKIGEAKGIKIGRAAIIKKLRSLGVDEAILQKADEDE